MFLKDGGHFKLFGIVFVKQCHGHTRVEFQFPSDFV
jgi:hypothetical protein